MRTIHALPCMLGLLAAIGGCSAAARMERESFALREQGLAVAPEADAAAATSSDPMAAASDTAAVTAQAAPGRSARLMVYRASFDVLVPNVEDALARFLKRVEESGGYLESRENTLVTCRVPAERFQALADEVRTYGLVVRESVKAVDVTARFRDLSIRIDNAAKARERLLALLEHAGTLDETLKLEAALRRITEELECMKAELAQLSEQIAFSFLTVAFRSNAPPPVSSSRRISSRFAWVNEVGVEHVLQGF